MSNLPSVSDSNLPARRPLVFGELEQFIKEATADLVAALQPFTAYSVTLRIQVNHPDVEVRHRDVGDDIRLQVSIYMSQYNDWHVESRDWNGQPAATYVWDDPAAVPDVPALSAPVPASIPATLPVGTPIPGILIIDPNE